MTKALIYLWLALLKRRALHFCRQLRRPTAIVGVAAVLCLVAFLFHFRRHEIFAIFARPGSLVGGMLLMLGGSVFTGFLQRGLVFEPPDIEFLFTSPFTQRQIVLYRLLPSYVFAVVQGFAFWALLQLHLKHPLATTLCFILFQIACFHISMGAAILAGTIPQALHERVRWMILGVYALITAIYLHVAWDLSLVPSFATSRLAQLVFYPALSLTDVASSSAFHELGLRLRGSHPISFRLLLEQSLYLLGFGLGAVASLWLLLRLKANIFETSLATTTRVAERRQRIQAGRRIITVATTGLRSVGLPKLRLFQGVGAVVWKNLLIARRSKRELSLAVAFSLVYVGLLLALRWVLHRNMAEGGSLAPRELRDFDGALGVMLCALVFFLQRSFPFDFRSDGHHVVAFRTLPVSAFSLVLAEITVPTVLCLAFQGAGFLMLLLTGGFEWHVMLLVLFGFPAVALGLNGVWNLHYLLGATRSAGGKAQSATAIGTLMTVALSFLIFYPAGWVTVTVGQHARLGVALAAWVATQYSVDLAVLLIIARLFRRFEASREG